MSHGVEYLGFRFYLTETGKVINRLRSSSKRRIVSKYNRVIKNDNLSIEYKNQVKSSYKEYVSRCQPSTRFLKIEKSR